MKWMLGFVLVGSLEAGEWQRNTFPSEKHVAAGFAPGAGWDHNEATMDLAVSPLDANFRVMIENEWGAVFTEDGLNYKPLRMPHIGTPGCSAQSVEFSRYDANTLYLRVAHVFWSRFDTSKDPAGLWRSRDRGVTWSQLYRPPEGGYERDSADNAGTTHMLEDPCALRTNHLYFGSTSHGLMRSTDGGATWSSMVPALTNRCIKTVTAACGANNETVLYAIAERKMARHIQGQTVPIGAFSNSDYDARWRFEKNLKDDSGNGYHLTGTNPTWGTAPAEGVWSAGFNGTKTLTAAGLTYTNAQELVTVSAWVKTSLNGNQTIVSFDQNEYWELGVKLNAGIVWRVRDSGGTTSELVGPRVDDGEWYHVVGVFNRGAVSLYVDGELVASATAGTTQFGSGNVVSGVVGTGFTGNLDDVRIFNGRAFNLNAVYGAYYECAHKSSIADGALWRIRVNSAGAMTEAARLYAPASDFFGVEVNPLDPSTGWVIRKGFPLTDRQGGRTLSRFTNYGNTLQASTAALGDSTSYNQVLINPGNTNHVVLMCGGPMVNSFRFSMNGGSTWQMMNRPVTNDLIPSFLSWNPCDYKWFSGLPTGWEKSNGAVISFVPGAVNEVLWVKQSSGGIMRSTDYGAMFESYGVGGPNKDVGQLTVAHGNPNYWSIGLYEYGFSTTTNGGLSWYGTTHQNTTLLDTLATKAEAAGDWWTAARIGGGVAFHPTNPKIMVGSWSRQGYILRSTDAGITWVDTKARNPMEMMVDVHWSRTDANRVYCGKMKSTNGGVAWQNIGKVVLAVCDANSDLLVGVDDWALSVAAGSLNMYLSTNGGVTWVSLPDPPAESVPGLNNTKWEVTGTASKWNCLADGLIAIDPSPSHDPTRASTNRFRILLAGRSGIYEYNAPNANGSGSESDWTVRRTGIENSRHYNLVTPVPWMGFVVFDPRPGYEHVVYAAKQNDDRKLCEWGGLSNKNHAYPGGDNFEPFYRSTDGGRTWTKLHGAAYPQAPQSAMIESMLVDSTGRMLAGTTEGIYVYTHTDEGIEFVSEEGYASGELVGQAGWTGDTGVFTVDTNGTGVVRVGATAWKKAIFGTGLSGTAFTLGAAFNFTESTAAGSAQSAFRLDLVVATETASLALKRMADGRYQLVFNENSGTGSFLNSSPVTPQAVGTTNGPGSESDRLYMELTIAKGAESGNWTYGIILRNMSQDPGRLSAPLITASGSFASTSGFYTGVVHPAMTSAARSAANWSSLNVDSLWVESDLTAFAQWISGYALSGANAGMDANPDSDTYNNFMEYALGGDPTQSDDEVTKPRITVGNGCDFIYRRRIDATAAGLVYEVETTTNLVAGGWTTERVVEGSTAAIGDGLEVVTNQVDVTESNLFIRLQVRETGL